MDFLLNQIYFVLKDQPKIDDFRKVIETLLSFHINARKQFNNNLTFDFTEFPSKIVEVLLDALHFEIPILPSAVKNLPDMLELIAFLLDDGKIRYVHFEPRRSSILTFIYTCLEKIFH